MNVDVDLHDYFEGFSFEYRGVLRVPWNIRKTKLDGKLELVDNPGLNRTKINNFKIAVKLVDLSYLREFGEVGGKQMVEYVVSCYAELTATNVVTTEVQVLDRWPSNLGDNYEDSGNQYPADEAAPPKKGKLMAERKAAGAPKKRATAQRRTKR